MNSSNAEWTTKNLRPFIPKCRPPLATYIRRLSLQHEELDRQHFAKENNSVIFLPSISQRRMSIRLRTSEDDCYLNNNLQFTTLNMKREGIQNNEMSVRQRSTSTSRKKIMFDKVNSEYDEQMTDGSDGEDNEIRFAHSQNRSRSISPKYLNVPLKKKLQSKENPQLSNTKQNMTNYFLLLIFVVIIILVLLVIKKASVNKKQTQSINNTKVLFKNIEDIKIRFHNQESSIWNDISSGINEVMTRTPKTPSIILLFANETNTMDCLASALAHVSSTILGSDSPLCLNPEDFGDDLGEVIDSLNKEIPRKKAVLIRDVLNINAEAIKALHNLCDRINPLVEEAIYIITMKTGNYKSSQKKLAFVEKQIYNKLSKSIDQDILMALVTRITDGAIISVQPEQNLRYCGFESRAKL